MFEDQYNEQMEVEIKLLEAKKRAADAGHHDWVNACTGCSCQLDTVTTTVCDNCR